MVHRLRITIISVFLMAMSSGTVTASNAPYNDYYNGPVHYTSYQRTIYNDRDLMVANEKTDAFSGTFHFPKDKSYGVATFGGQITNFFEVPRKEVRDLMPEWDYKYPDDTRFYLNECPPVNCNEDDPIYVYVAPSSMTLIVQIWGPDQTHDIAFDPTRFTICKKIAAQRKAANSAMFADLFKTLLLAGVQSYTGYQTYQGNGNVYGANGHFGYSERGTYRDYSWAGARAADALNTIFSGSANASDLDRAWNSLNCF
jgi:hypothetical protein